MQNCRIGTARSPQGECVAFVRRRGEAERLDGGGPMGPAPGVWVLKARARDCDPRHPCAASSPARFSRTVTVLGWSAP